jgi:hypothetical protein
MRKRRREPPKGTKTPKGKVRKGEYMYGADRTQMGKQILKG